MMGMDTTTPLWGPRLVRVMLRAGRRAGGRVGGRAGGEGRCTGRVGGVAVQQVDCEVPLTVGNRGRQGVTTGD